MYSVLNRFFELAGRHADMGFKGALKCSQILETNQIGYFCNGIILRIYSDDGLFDTVSR